MKKLMPIIAAFLIVLTTLGCGGEESATQETSPDTTEQASNRAEANTAIPPTRPQRIENIREAATTQAQQPTPEPAGPEPDTPAEPQQPEGGNPGTGTEAGPATDIDNLIPENAQFNDRVLLQDIYARMDLQKFALNPGEPIEFLDPPGDKRN